MDTLSVFQSSKLPMFPLYLANEQAKTQSKVKSNVMPRKDGLLARGSVTQSVREYIIAKLEEERKTGVTHTDLKSGDIHRQMNFNN